jgi:hypothetical protein
MGIPAIAQFASHAVTPTGPDLGASPRTAVTVRNIAPSALMWPSVGSKHDLGDVYHEDLSFRDGEPCPPMTHSSRTSGQRYMLGSCGCLAWQSTVGGRGSHLRMYSPLTNTVSTACSDQQHRQPIKFGRATDASPGCRPRGRGSERPSAQDDDSVVVRETRFPEHRGGGVNRGITVAPAEASTPVPPLRLPGIGRNRTSAADRPDRAMRNGMVSL